MELQTIQSKIYEIRGVRVMLDRDLAELYGIETAQLKRAVRRNIERFAGDDFMFELTNDEHNDLKTSLTYQIGTSNDGGGRGGSRYAPFAFTELGVAMLSSVLNSLTAIEINRGIMRAFVAMRNYIATTSTMTAEIAELRATIELLRRDGEDTLEAVNDLSEDTRKHLDNLYNAIGELSVKPAKVDPDRRKIGYKIGDE